MEQKKLGIRKSFTPWKDSRFRFFSGILVGLFYALAFYSLLYCTREVMRVLSITEYYDLWTLTESEVQFYNLFFAALSMILGQAICFTIWLERPRKPGQRYYRRTVSILVDHKVLLWFFLAWFSKLTIVIALLFTTSYTSADFYALSLYPKYRYLFVLIILVLFLQSWNNFLLKHKGLGYRWVLVSALMLSLLSFSMSQWNVVDYKKLNQKVLSKNSFHKYDIRLPKSDYYKVARREYNSKKLFLVLPQPSKKMEPEIILGSERCGFYEAVAKIYEMQQKRPQELKYVSPFILNVGPGITMDHMATLKENMAAFSLHQLHIAVVPNNAELDERYYTRHYIPLASRAYYHPNDRRLQDKYIIPIEFTDAGSYLVNSVQVPAGALQEYVATLIAIHPNYAFILTVEAQLQFETYFYAYRSVVNPIIAKRENYSKEIFGKSMEALYYEEQKQVIKKYPLTLLETRKGDFPFLDRYLEIYPLALMAPNYPPR